MRTFSLSALMLTTLLAWSFSLSVIPTSKRLPNYNAIPKNTGGVLGVIPTSKRLPNYTVISKNIGGALNADVQALLQACQAVQSPTSQRKVEECIGRLQEKAAQKQNANLRQKVKRGVAYRTIWSTVTASTLAGQALRQAPNKILGGDSWQLISEDGSKAENIVYWTIGNLLSVRMAGLADLKPLVASNAYELVIRGLEFRWGKPGYLPEVYAERCRSILQQAKSINKSSARLFYLDDGKVLDNGRGTLDILYFDGQLRISRDSVQENTYVHLMEPLSSPFAKLYPEVA